MYDRSDSSSEAEPGVILPMKDVGEMEERNWSQEETIFKKKKRIGDDGKPVHRVRYSDFKQRAFQQKKIVRMQVTKKSLFDNENARLILSQSSTVPHRAELKENKGRIRPNKINLLSLFKLVFKGYTDDFSQNVFVYELTTVVKGRVSV